MNFSKNPKTAQNKIKDDLNDKVMNDQVSFLEPDTVARPQLMNNNPSCNLTLTESEIKECCGGNPSTF